MSKNNSDNTKMAITRKGLWLLAMGFVVMVSGFILLMGGGIEDPDVFNYSMFDFRRLVAAPVVILAGVAIGIVAIIKRPRGISGE